MNNKREQTVKKTAELFDEFKRMKILERHFQGKAKEIGTGLLKLMQQNEQNKVQDSDYVVSREIRISSIYSEEFRKYLGKLKNKEMSEGDVEIKKTEFLVFRNRKRGE